MNSTLKQNYDSGDCSDLPPVPQRILSRDGVVVETGTAIWHLSRASDPSVNYRIDWGLLDHVGAYPRLTLRARHLLKLYLADRISKKKTSTIRANYGSFTRWLATHGVDSPVDLQHFNWSDVSEGLARAFLEWGVRHTAEKGIHFLCLRAFYEWGVARGYADFHWDTLGRIKPIKATGNAKGHNVRFHHPTKGPYSSDELFQIRKALLAKQGTDQDRAIVMLHLELGLNPYASIQIINADFKRYETENVIAYQANIPCIKKRTVHRETKRRPISSTLGQLLEHLQQGGPEDPLLHWLGLSWAEKAITQAMRRFVRVAGIISPQTETVLHMSPRRFRTSLATHMAAQGASKFHIAEILDHTDLSNVDVYVQTQSSIADDLAAATDRTLQPLVKRFLGKIVEATEIGEGTQEQIIPAYAPYLPLPMLNTGGLGLCGNDVPKNGLCRLLPPLSCYLCSSFVAFRHGPHEEMLEALLNFLQQAKGTADDRILKQLDDVCTAISEVLAQVRSNPQKGSSAAQTKSDGKDM